MTEQANQSLFDRMRQRSEAFEALDGLSDKDKVRHAYAVIAGITDPAAIVPLGSVSVLAAEQVNKLQRAEVASRREDFGDGIDTREHMLGCLALAHIRAEQEEQVSVEGAA